MVVVEFAYSEMKKLVDLPLEKMIASLNELGAPSEYEPELDKIITELTPNRPDWYSMEGLSRSLKAYHGLNHPKYSVRKSSYKVKVDPSLAKVRPHTACAVVKGLRFNDQRIKDVVLLQEKLLATLGRRVKKFGIGIYPLDAITFPVEYTTKRPEEIVYVPLGYDRKMSAAEILKTHKKGEQYGHIIERFDRYPVYMDALGKIMALIPIVNSAETGRVDENTKDVFIEVSGTDIHACEAALNIIVCTFADMGGTIYEVEVDYGRKKAITPDLSGKVMGLDLERVNRTLGLHLKDKEAGQLLVRMGYEYKAGKAMIPPYRADVIGWVDVMEDIAISYGYNNFEYTLPDFFSSGHVLGRYDGIDETMRGMGFLEIKTFILTNREKLDLVGYGGSLLEISNPGSVEYTVVRPNLLADMLETFSINKMKGLPQKFYEIGLVHDGKSQGERLVVGIMDKKLDFSSIRGYIQTLAKEQGFDFKLERQEMTLFEPELSCAVVSGGKRIGVFGKVAKGIMEKTGLQFEGYICEIILG